MWRSRCRRRRRRRILRSLLLNQPNNEDGQVMTERKCGERRPPYRESKKIMTGKRKGANLVAVFSLRCRLGKFDF